MLKKLILFLVELLPFKFSSQILFLYQKFLFEYQSQYFCQDDLDLKLMSHIKKKNGTFLEVGAFNGLTGSVTLRFEKFLNWSGILIEPLKHAYEHLREVRGKQNICINSACTESDIKKTVKISNLGRMSYIHTLKGIDINKKKQNEIAKKLLLGTGKIEVCPNNTLTNILIKNKISNLDLAVIDIEGSEHLLFKWFKYEKN